MLDENFEWDDQKSETNKHKHGIDFSEARSLWKAGVDEFPSPQRGQMSYVAFGKLRNKLTLMVVTYRGARRRIISARHATADERLAYENAKRRAKGKT